MIKKLFTSICDWSDAYMEKIGLNHEFEDYMVEPLETEWQITPTQGVIFITVILTLVGIIEGL